MTAVVSPPPCESPDGFRHLQDLAAHLNGHWRYRPAGAALEVAVQRTAAEVEAVLQRAKTDVESALRQVEAARRDGPDVLIAIAYGDSIPGLRDEALFTALTLWGENARLEVEAISDVGTSIGIRGRFRARVRVRCLNYAEIGQ